MEKELTTKNTKNEILNAYNELLEIFQKNKKEQPKEVKQQQEKINLVEKVKENSEQNIIETINKFKTNINNELYNLSDSLLTEYNKFTELQKAIEIEEKRLKELYEINSNADTLAVLLLTQKEQKEKFEQELKEQKQKVDKDIQEALTKFEIEKQKFEAEDLEYKNNIKKTRQRENEEYEYNLKLTRKKENDIYSEKMAKLEKDIATRKEAFELEISQREESVTKAEQELKELRLKSENFSKEIAKAVAETETRITEKLQMDFKYQTDLMAKETEGELKLKEQIIQTLNEKIKDQDNLIKQLSQKSEQAEKNVKEIVIKAIENSSKIRFVENIKDNNAE